MFRCFPKFPIHFFFSTGKQFGLVSFPAAPRAQSGIPSPLPRLRRPAAALLFALPLLLSVCARGGGLWRSRASRGRWCGQRSCRTDLHLSAFHPERAADFRRRVGDALAVVNPALVLSTGDLTGRITGSCLLPFARGWNFGLVYSRGFGSGSSLTCDCAFELLLKI